MASTTSLLKTQKSRLASIQAQEDAVIDYEWQLSDKSAEALQAYNAHYMGRLNDPQSDPAKALSYSKKMNTANSAYTSNEIQRASIDIIEGNQPEAYKIPVLESLYKQAYEVGNLDLAQSLRLQIDNQYVKMQNAALSAGGGGGSLSTADSQLVKLATATLSDVNTGNIPFPDLSGLTPADLASVLNEGGLQNASDVLQKAAGGPDALKAIFGDANVNPIQALAGMESAMYAQAGQIIAQIQDPTEKAAALSKLNNQIKTDKINIGGKTFTLDELKTESDNISQGNPSIRLALGPNGLVAEGRPAVQYAFAFNENGDPVVQNAGYAPKAMAIYGDASVGAQQFGYPVGGTDSAGKPVQVYYKANAQGNMEVVPYDQAYDKNGNAKLAKDKKAYTADQVIQAAGFQKSGKSWVVSDPTLRQQLLEKGVSESAISQDAFVINPDGSVQFKTPTGQLFQAVTDSFKDGKGVTHIYDVQPGSRSQFEASGRTAASTTTVLGTQMQRDLQTNLSGSAFQGANTAPYIQNAGGTTGVLQNAATMRQLNELQTQNLRVQNAPVAPAISVQPYQAPTPIKVNQTITQYPIKVTQPVAPAIHVNPTQPSNLSGSVQGGGIKLQGGSGSLQGSSPYLQGGFSGTLRVQ